MTFENQVYCNNFKINFSELSFIPKQILAVENYIWLIDDSQSTCFSHANKGHTDSYILYKMAKHKDNIYDDVLDELPYSINMPYSVYNKVTRRAAIVPSNFNLRELHIGNYICINIIKPNVPLISVFDNIDDYIYFTVS